MRFINKIVPKAIKGFIKDITGITALNATMAQYSAKMSSIEADIERLETDMAFCRQNALHLENELAKLNVESELILSRGKFKSIEITDGTLHISGWMITPASALDKAQLFVNGACMAESEIVECADGPKECRWIPHAKDSGFSFAVRLTPRELDGMLKIAVVGMVKKRKVTQLETWFRRDLYDLMPAPPVHLMVRENNISSLARHFISGLGSYRDFWQKICTYTEPGSIRNFLDWGCGAGRITGFFLKFSGIPYIHGCDIDAEAIEWCRQNLKPAEFSTIPLYPPTQYPDSAFDVIISYSVLTHLPREVQNQRLREMSRILAPGGLFLATVHGDFAIQTSFSSRKAKEICESGIYDKFSQSLDGVAPPDYYRGVFQTRKYTQREFAQFFDILEYADAGALSFQDLIIMRKKS